GPERADILGAPRRQERAQKPVDASRQPIEKRALLQRVDRQRGAVEPLDVILRELVVGVDKRLQVIRPAAAAPFEIEVGEDGFLDPGGDRKIVGVAERRLSEDKPAEPVGRVAVGGFHRISLSPGQPCAMVKALAAAVSSDWVSPWTSPVPDPGATPTPSISIAKTSRVRF